MRTIEATHIKDPHKNIHEDVKFSDVPRGLQGFVNRSMTQIKMCGFRDFLTGRKMELKEGRTNTFYLIFVSEDRSTLAEFTHVRVARVLTIWPASLPLSEYIGPVVLTLAFETLFSNDHTLITTSEPGVKLLNMPSVHVNSVESSATYQEQWESHRRELRRLLEELKSEIVPMTNRESYFNKSVIQRRQIVSDEQRRMKELREESSADLWDSKP